MNRRRYLQTVAAGLTAAGIAGCQSGGGGTTTQRTTTEGPELTPSPNVKLDPPESIRADPENLPYPAWSQQIPEVTLPAALRERDVTTTEFDTPLALTFIFSNCMDACPLLTQALTRAQDRAEAGGYAEGVNFAEITFDPERDTADRLREYADERSIGLDNWYFLRPPTVERANAVVSDEFGVFFEKQPQEDSEGYMYLHSSLILLVNEDGYVERTYDGGQDGMQNLPSDMNALRQA